MIQNILFSFFGGICLFLFGMDMMSLALKNLAGKNLKKIIEKFTAHPVSGILTGAGLTALVQSSSATTVMILGLVSAGAVTLGGAIPVVLGANIGTTLTSWIVSMEAFKISEYALPMIGIGFILKISSGRKKIRHTGEFLLGLGILFLALSIVKSAFAPLIENGIIKNMLVVFSVKPVWGIIAGALATALLQSSSAAVAIVQMLCFTGIIPFGAAIPIVLGENIGTTITAQIASIGRGVHAKRLAWAHTLFNVIGVGYMLIFVRTGLYEKAVLAIIPGALTKSNIMLHVAVAHTLFNVVNMALFLPFIKILERLTVYFVPLAGKLPRGPIYLEKHLLEVPLIALYQVKKEMKRMLGVAEDSLKNANGAFFDFDANKIRQAQKLEDVTDGFQQEIGSYLAQISQESLEKEDAIQIPVIIHSINDIERMGDHAVNISKLAEKVQDDNIKFTDKGIEEMRNMKNAVEKMLVLLEKSLGEEEKNTAKEIIETETAVNKMFDDYRRNHARRIAAGLSGVFSGPVFMDYLQNLEKIGDHATNIAQSIATNYEWGNVVTQKSNSEK